jgi:hypothetical protein
MKRTQEKSSSPQKDSTTLGPGRNFPQELKIQNLTNHLLEKEMVQFYIGTYSRPQQEWLMAHIVKWIKEYES